MVGRTASTPGTSRRRSSERPRRQGCRRRESLCPPSCPLHTIFDESVDAGDDDAVNCEGRGAREANHYRKNDSNCYLDLRQHIGLAHFDLRSFSCIASIIHSRRVLPWSAAEDFALRINSSGTTRTFRAVFLSGASGMVVDVTYTTPVSQWPEEV